MGALVMHSLQPCVFLLPILLKPEKLAWLSEKKSSCIEQGKLQDLLPSSSFSVPAPINESCALKTPFCRPQSSVWRFEECGSGN